MDDDGPPPLVERPNDFYIPFSPYDALPPLVTPSFGRIETTHYIDGAFLEDTDMDLPPLVDFPCAPFDINSDGPPPFYTLASPPYPHRAISGGHALTSFPPPSPTRFELFASEAAFQLAPPQGGTPASSPPPSAAPSPFAYGFDAGGYDAGAPSYGEGKQPASPEPAVQQHASAGTMMFHQWQTAPAAAPKPEPTESTTQTPAGPQHIPRPPNAFILFRSSFIRSRSVPASLVPNHSALSKICGKIWNALPREEKKYWEEKAEEALKVHRERYPEWRWVAGGGAGGGGGKKRGRIKDGGGEEGRGRGKEKEKAPRKKATAKKSAKADVLGDTPSASGASEGGGGKDRAARRRAEKKREASADARCAKIAEMVADGAVGDELERAIEDWERVTGGSGSTSSANPGGDETPASPVSNPSQQSADQQKQQQEAQRTVRARRGTDASASSRASASSTTSRASTGASGALPLTAMFRRGTSSPASEGPASPPPPTPALPAAPMPAPVPVQQVPTLAPVPRTARRAGMHRPVPAPVVEERVPQMALEDRRTHRRTHTSQTSSGAGMPPPASLARPGGLMAFSGPAMARRHSIAAAGPPADVMGSGGMGAHIHGMGVGGLGAVQSAPPTPPGAWGWERVSTCLVGLPTCPSLAGDVCASCAFGFAGAGSPGPPAPALPGYAPQYAPYGAPPVRQQQQQPAQQQAAPVSTYSELFAWAGAPPEGAPAKRGKTGEVDAGRW